ncbi:transporter substrate-binding domain-containing protein [Collinsella tanakaei]|uniref:transporter substrate-binding domain-containing protein n=1 Tax=Collinsella tanakaei TaxID=626935 RepID=UPI001F22F55F|nr:transporter substrate-binding domain-containing protein [Collinsella tanakaei]MCF2621931.1 transporter substrate-binding domain-containing protein [Collinsella tanakaei]MDM8302358.1 transporter substrate-binding domain-containing protein [Collinsella tanakaei]
MKMSRRQFLQICGLGVASVAGASALAGCGGGSDGGNGSSSDATSKLQTIKDRGKLAAGVKADVLGYGYLNTETNEYEGLEIDLCYQVAAAVLGVSYDEAKEQKLVEFTTVTPKTRGPLIDNDTLDIVCATYTITDERLEDWDFSDPYRTDHVGIMIMKSSGMSSMADLDGKIIGVSQGSTTKDAILTMLEDEGIDATPEFKEYADYPSINSALESGNIDAFAMDRSTLNTYMNDQKELLQPEIEFGEQNYGIATKKGSDLSEVVNETVNELLDNGWLDEEAETWNLL